MFIGSDIGYSVCSDRVFRLGVISRGVHRFGLRVFVSVRCDLYACPSVRFTGFLGVV